MSNPLTPPITPVTDVALIQRINCVLTKEGQALRKTTKQWESSLGAYHIIDPYQNAVVADHQDLEALALELGVFRAGEVLTHQ